VLQSVVPGGERMGLTVTIHVDARCLQDEAYRHRGVGQHAASVLAAARTAFAPGGGVHLTGLLDRTRPDLEREHLDLFDSVKHSATGLGKSDWFLSLSPMTHSPGPMTAMFIGCCRAQGGDPLRFHPAGGPDSLSFWRAATGGLSQRTSLAITLRSVPMYLGVHLHRSCAPRAGLGSEAPC